MLASSCASNNSGTKNKNGRAAGTAQAGGSAQGARTNGNQPAFGNASKPDSGNNTGSPAGKQPNNQPGGCVHPGEPNEFRLRLCPMPDAMTDAMSLDAAPRKTPRCQVGYDQLGRPLCLDDAGIPKPPPPPSCLRGGLCKQLVLAGSGQLDVLFMIDDSGSMREEQQALVKEMPRLISVLTSGDVDADGVQDFPAVKDLHLGVVSSDLGLPNGTPALSNCAGLGDDGVLHNTPSASVTGCASSYPRFLSYDASQVDPKQAALDFACIGTLGTNGCGFEEPLESVLKAITPSTSDVRFLPDAATKPATVGRADGVNRGFLRSESLVALIVVTDEDDCSAREPRLFTQPAYLAPNDPLNAQELNLRCYYNKQDLFDVARYVNGYQALRPPGSNLVLFAAITGVPPSLVDDTARAGIDFNDPVARDKYYDALLAAPEMQEMVDPTSTPGIGELVPSCTADTSVTGRAYPPRRIVQVAKGFGVNGVIQSICQSSFAPALQPIVERISASLTAGCIGKAFTRDADGKIACDVVWELPAPGTPGASLQLCEERAFLSTPDNRDLRSTADGRTRCLVTQVPVLRTDAGVGPKASGSGFYYDDFSSEATDKCGAAAHQRVIFTHDVEVPPDVRVYVDCSP